MKTRKVFNNYDVEITLHKDTCITLDNDDDIAEVLHNLIELFEDNTKNNSKDNEIQKHLHCALNILTHYNII